MRLKQVRVEHGYSQEQIADVLGVARNSYTMMESGSRGISADKLVKLANFYRCSTDELLGSQYFYEVISLGGQDEHPEAQNR